MINKSDPESTKNGTKNNLPPQTAKSPDLRIFFDTIDDDAIPDVLQEKYLTSKMYKTSDILWVRTFNQAMGYNFTLEEPSFQS